jgi:hypothetical protein
VSRAVRAVTVCSDRWCLVHHRYSFGTAKTQSSSIKYSSGDDSIMA